MKINNFRLELTVITAKKEAMVKTAPGFVSPAGYLDHINGLFL